MTLTIVTASYALDFGGFTRLHDSVVRHTDDGVRHIVIVPDAHAPLFRSIDSPRLEVRPYSAVLPRRFLQTSWVATLPGMPRGFRIAAVNVARPWPPIRGWIMQQLVKLAVVADLESDVAVLIDSDVVVVRTLSESAFLRSDGAVRLYRQPHGITESMTRHVAQRTRALELLGIPRPEPESPDYISAFVSWKPALVRDCVARIAATTGRDWRDAVAGSLDFSEYITYGSYAMSLAAVEERGFVVERSLCHSYWEDDPLTMDSAPEFVEALRPDDLAIHVQSNSSTDATVLAYIEDAVRTVDGA